MADLVEFVIDGILKREQMQQHAKRQQSGQISGKVSAAQGVRDAHALQISQASQSNLRGVGSQNPTTLKEKDAELWKVSRQFEAIFVQQMMSEMRKTVSKSDFMPSGYAEDVHASMMDQAIAQASAKRSNFGIADNIYRQLEAATKNIVTKDQASIQEISKTADNLEMSSSLAMEVKHAN